METTIVAPHSSIGQTLSVPLQDGETFKATVPDDRTLKVPEPVAAELLAHPGWQELNQRNAARIEEESKLIKDPALAPLRARREALTKSEAALCKIAAEAGAHLAEAEGRLSAGRAALATSAATVQDVTRAQ